MLKFKGWVCGLAGFMLGITLSGIIGALGHSSSPSLPPSSDKPQAQAAAWNSDASHVISQRIVVSVVKDNEVEAAINTFAAGAQRKIRKDVANGKFRLAWLTVWDWDTAPGEVGNTISILSDDYRRYVTLTERRTPIAIPVPRSGYIEMRGEVSEDDNISISLLSGTQPIALPIMSPGQALRVQVDISDKAGHLSASVQPGASYPDSN